MVNLGNFLSMLETYKGVEGKALQTSVTDQFSYICVKAGKQNQLR